MVDPFRAKLLRVLVDMLSDPLHDQKPEMNRLHLKRVVSSERINGGANKPVLVALCQDPCLLRLCKKGALINQLVLFLSQA